MGLVPEQWSHRAEYSRLQKVPCKLYSLALELTNNFIIWNGASPLRCYCFIWNFLLIYYLFINEDDLYSLDRNISLKIQICKIYIFVWQSDFWWLPLVLEYDRKWQTHTFTDFLCLSLTKLVLYKLSEEAIFGVKARSLDSQAIVCYTLV